MASLLIALWPPLAPDPCRPHLGRDLIWDTKEKPSFRRQTGEVSGRQARGMSLPLARFVASGGPGLPRTPNLSVLTGKMSELNSGISRFLLTHKVYDSDHCKALLMPQGQERDGTGAFWPGVKKGSGISFPLTLECGPLFLE